jgi:hypothetical protein
MSLNTRRTPERNSPFLSGPVIQNGATVSNVLTTAGGAETITVAELLKGLLVADTQDAQTWTLPTAALLNAGLDGVKVGDTIEFTVANYGDSTLTIGLGTGITKTTIAGVAAIMTIATLTAKRFRLECTGVARPFDPSTSDAWVVWTIGAGTVAA